VYAGPPLDAAETASRESQARYITRLVLAMEALHRRDDGSLVLETPPDPGTGATSIELDSLEWIDILKPRESGRCAFSCFPADSFRFSLPSG
jgi:hypothetical protein